MTFHALIFLGGFLFARMWGAAERVPVEPGPQTTVIVEPLLEDGRIDYIAALNRRLGEGVEPGENAYIDLLATIPPAELEGWWVEGAMPLLGVDRLPEGRVLAPDWMGAEALEVVSRPWRAEELPGVSRWLDEHAAAIDAAAGASKKAKYFAPLVSNAEPPMLHALLPQLGRVRRLGNVLRARAERRIAAGDLEGAWGDVLSIKRWARLVSREPTMIGKLVALSLEGLSREPTEHLLSSPALTAALVKRVRADLAKLDPLPSPLVAISEGERAFGLDTVQWFARGGLERIDQLVGLMNTPLGKVFDQADSERRADVLRRLPNPLVYWDPNVTLRVMNRYYDAAAAMADTPTAHAAREIGDEIEQETMRMSGSLRGTLRNPAALLRAVVQPRTLVTQMMTHLTISLIMPAINAAERTKRIFDAYTPLQEVAAAIAHYRVEHDGRYPPSLDAVVPGYLDAVPVDPFTGVPLRYRVDDGGRAVTIWSVGPDGRDDGGGPRTEGVDDVSVRLAPPLERP